MENFCLRARLPNASLQAAFILLVAVVVVSGGCAVGIIGRMVDADRRISLEAQGVNAGQISTSDVDIVYEFEWSPASGNTGGTLDVRGRVVRYRWRGEGLIVYLHFLGPDGRVMDQQVALFNAYRSGYRRHGFERTFNVPENATGFTFSSLLRTDRGSR